MSIPNDLKKLIQHGDYQRIADLCVKTDGQKYSRKTVRAVLTDDRHNEYIRKTAIEYLKNKMKFQESIAQ